MKNLASSYFQRQFAAGCAANNSSNKTGSAIEHPAIGGCQSEKLDKATADYKTFVQGQIDQLLTDTEKFRDTLKEGKQ